MLAENGDLPLLCKYLYKEGGKITKPEIHTHTQHHLNRLIYIPTP